MDRTQNQFPFATSRIQMWVVGLCLLVLAVLWGGLLSGFSRDQAAELLDAEAENAKLARIFEEHASRTLRTADLTLRQVAAEYQRQGSAFDLARFSADNHIAQEDPYHTVTILDKNGDLILANIPIVGRQNYSDRDSYRTLSVENTDRMHIAKPWIGRATGKQTVYLSRRVNAPDGSFAGTVGIGLSPDYFASIYKDVDLGKDSIVALVGLDGIVRTRISNGEVSAGQDVHDAPLTKRFLAASEGNFREISQINKVPRLYSFRVLQNYPLVVVVGKSERVVLARHNEYRRVLTMIGAGASILVLAFVAAILLQFRRHSGTVDRLAESEERLERVIQATHDGIWDWTIATGEDYLSPRWKEILGYGDDELPNVASSFFDLIHPDDKSAVENAVRRHLENNEPYRVEFRLLHKDGTWRWILSRGQAVRDAQGNPIRMVGSVTDITEQKAAKESLQGERDRLRQILDAQFGFVTVLALDGAIEEINRTPLKLMNLSRDHVLGRLFWDIGWLEPGTEPSIQAAIAAAARGQVVRDDIRAQFPDMGPRDVDAIFHPLKDAAGRITNVIGFGVDITERKQAEDALKKAHAELEERIEARTHELSVERERFQTSQTFANIGTWDWNIVTGALYWSERIGPLFGYGNRKIETTYENFLAAIHPDDRQAVIDAVKACVEKGVEYDIEHRIVRADGQVRWLSEKGDVLRDALGRPIRMLGVVQDITDRKMTDDHMRHAQKLESLGNMAGGVAHSLNNLLVPILALSKMTADSLPQGSPARAALDKVVEASGRARDLVARVLAFSRRDTPRKTAIDLRVTLEDALRLARSSISSTIQLESDIPAQPIRVMADAPQIEAVIMNLVTNAVAAIGDRVGGRIAVRLAAGNDEARTAKRPSKFSGQPHAVLTVEDNGAGMTAAVKERIFDPFFTTKKVGEGTGLGLSMAHGIVEEHGGSIDVDSEPGKGSTFRIHLPLAAATHPAREPA